MEQGPEFIGLLLQYREVEKLRGPTERVCSSRSPPTGASTPRSTRPSPAPAGSARTGPNLHNIPVRRDEGRHFRRVFVPASGYVMLVADYNQIELRRIAHLAADPGLIAALTSGSSTSTTPMAARCSPWTRARSPSTSSAKMVSYGLAYGMEAYGLGQRTNIPTEEAVVILDAYFEAFPNVKSYMDRTVVEARKVGYTEMMFGRRRPIPELLDGNWRSARPASARR